MIFLEAYPWDVNLMASSESIYLKSGFQKAISEFPLASSSKRVMVIHMQIKLIFKWKDEHQDSLWGRG